MNLSRREITYLKFPIVMLAMMTGVFALSAVAMLFHIPLTRYHVPISSFSVLLLLTFLSRKSALRIRPPEFLLYIVLYALLVYALGQVAELIWDQSSDGRWYHAEAIQRLARGWNPVYDETDQRFNIYVIHYAKSSWYLAAALQLTLGSFEKAKMFHLFLLLMTTWMTPVFFKKLFGLSGYLVPVVGMVLFAVNPVVIAQLFNLYNDGDLALGMIAILMLLFFYFYAPQSEKLFLETAMFFVIAYTAHTKFTGLLYLCFMLFFFLMYHAWRRKKEALRTLGYFALSFLLVVLVVGFDPLVTNTVEQGQPFYPLMGEGALDIMTDNTPSALQNKNRFEKAFLSLLAEPTDRDATQPLKITAEGLLSTEQPELYAAADLRIRGFGQYSPFVFVLTVLCSALMLLSPWRTKKETLDASLLAKKDHSYEFATPHSDPPIRLEEEASEWHGDKSTVVFVYGILIAIAVIGGEMWWARYVAYLWFLVPLSFCGICRNARIGRALLAVFLLIAVACNAQHFLTNNLTTNIERSDMLKHKVVSDLTDPEWDDADMQIARYYDVYLYKFWYEEKREVLGIEEVDPSIEPALQKVWHPAWGTEPQN